MKRPGEIRTANPLANGFRTKHTPTYSERNTPTYSVLATRFRFVLLHIKHNSVCLHGFH